jgi:cyclohexadieny/prephenate dehydrogenase
MKKLAIIGLGQLGTSIARDAREAMPELTIYGYDSNASHTAYAVSRGYIDTGCENISAAVHVADMVLFACPLRAYDAVAKAMQSAPLKPSAIITDIGSVKHPMQRVAAMFPHHAVVPGHPIAGSEKVGPEAGRTQLFHDKLMLLCPLSSTTPEAMETVAQFWEKLGAIIMQMPTEVHDQIYAHVSHLPHAVAFVAAHYFYSQHTSLQPDDDAVLKQFLRIGRSGSMMWRDVFLENHLALLPPLATYSALLEHFVRELRSGDAGTTSDAEKLPLLKAHLPRILAGTMISTVSLYEQQAGFDVRRFAAGGLRDIAAPAAMEPEEALPIISAHAGFLADATESILPHFRKLEQLIGAQDADGLLALLETMRSDAEMLFTQLQ